MTTYLLILTLQVGLVKPFDLPADARLDTLEHGQVVYQTVQVVASPAQGAVKTLQANRLRMLNNQWLGELYLIDQEHLRLIPQRLPAIQIPSDTLSFAKP